MPDFSLPLKKIKIFGEVETNIEWNDDLSDTESNIYFETRDIVEDNLIDLFESNYLVDDMSILDLTFTQKISSRTRKSVRSRHRRQVEVALTLVEFTATILMDEKSTVEDVASAFEVQASLESTSSNEILNMESLNFDELSEDEVFTIFDTENINALVDSSSETTSSTAMSSSTSTTSTTSLSTTPFSHRVRLPD